MLRISILLLWSAALAAAQTTLGSFTGRVQDPSGAAIPAANVTATNTSTGFVYKTVTNNAGSFSLQQLTLGAYEVAVEVPGFRRSVQRGLELNVAQTRQVDFSLEVGQVEQTVEVSSSATELQTATSDLGTTIQRKKLIDLPLFVGGNVRNLEQFIFLSPGVTGDVTNTQISGSPSRGKEVLIDGIGATGIESGGVIPGNARPSVETIGEFRLLRANFNAEYGRTGGGIQIFTTRSGTNDFHGALFNYLRNDKLDARGFFQRVRPINRQNEFGATLGGPIVIPRLYNGEPLAKLAFACGNPQIVAPSAALPVRTSDFSSWRGPLKSVRISTPIKTQKPCKSLSNQPHAEYRIHPPLAIRPRPPNRTLSPPGTRTRPPQQPTRPLPRRCRPHPLQPPSHR